MSRGPAPAAQLYVVRPNGTMLLHPLLSLDHGPAVIARLAPLVPLDATWSVIGPDQHP